MRPCYILLPWPVKNLAPERSLGINRHGTIRPGFLWAVGVSGHFLVGLGESVFSLIRHWAGMGTGWRSLWSQTTWKDLNGLEWRWITLRDFYLRLQESEITKPCLRLLKATTFLVSFLFFFFFFPLRVNIFQGCASGPLRIGTAVLRFPSGILASCNALRWQFIKKLREMGSDSCDWEDIKRGLDRIRWNAKCQLPLFMAAISRGPRIDVLESCGAFCMMLAWTPFFNLNCFKFFLCSLVSLFLLYLETETRGLNEKYACLLSLSQRKSQ